MKKRYISPIVDKIIPNCIMAGESNTSYGTSGGVEGQNDTDWDFGGNGNKNDPVDAKGNNIWDDEEW